MATSRAQANVTTDHDEIRRWAEARGAQPACVKGTGNKGDIGMLRLDFPGYGGEESLQHIGWEDWFEKFDERNLALLFQEQTAGGAQSNFNKLVSRETAEGAERSGKTRRGSAGTRRAPAKSASKKTSSSRAEGHRNGRTSNRSPAGGSTARKSSAKKASSSGRSGTAAKRGGRSASSPGRTSTKRTSGGANSKKASSSNRKSTTRGARKTSRSR